MHADYSAIASAAKTNEYINGYLKPDTISVPKQCVQNHMSSNAIKPKSMVIMTWQKLLILPENQRNLSIIMNNNTLENVFLYKLNNI